MFIIKTWQFSVTLVLKVQSSVPSPPKQPMLYINTCLVESITIPHDIATSYSTFISVLQQSGAWSSVVVKPLLY